jgi:hypothetical protein
VIVVSAEANIEDRIAKAGAHDLRKPISRERVLAIVRDVSAARMPDPGMHGGQ